MKAWLAGALCAVGVIGCGDGNSLSGSAGDVAQLNYDSVEVTAAPGALAISYKRTDGAVLTRIGVDTTDPNIVAGKPLDGNAFLKDVTLSRQMADANDVWPTPLSGQVTFHDYGLSVGEKVSGSFSVIFGPGGLFPRGGYELLGDFSGTAVAPH